MGSILEVPNLGKLTMTPVSLVVVILVASIMVILVIIAAALVCTSSASEGMSVMATIAVQP